MSWQGELGLVRGEVRGACLSKHNDSILSTEMGQESCYNESMLHIKKCEFKSFQLKL